MWYGMNFFMHKTKMGWFLILLKKAPHQMTFLHLIFHIWPSFANCKLLQQIMCWYVYGNDASCQLTAS